MRGKDEVDWDAVEDHVARAFHGRIRKDGQAMATHSINVGRLAMAHPLSDAVAVLAAYMHDLREDTDVGSEGMLGIAEEALGEGEDAEAAVLLAVECCYTDDEYMLPKADRKAAACRRWIAVAEDDVRVAIVKSSDVQDNDRSADSVSPEFAKGYRRWAMPLADALRERIAREQVATPAP